MKRFYWLVYRELIIVLSKYGLKWVATLVGTRDTEVCKDTLCWKHCFEYQMFVLGNCDSYFTVLMKIQVST